MRRKADFLLLWLLLVPLGALGPAGARGQQANSELTAVPAAASPALAGEVFELLREGQRLESELRWGEALTHYEDALRRYPNDRSLESRFASARLHYDLGRRYGDQTFREKVKALSLREATDVYSEVLLKIQAHYVETPNWKQLVAHGLNDLEIALSAPAFVGEHLSGVDASRIEAYRQELRRALTPRVVATRTEASDLVAWAAQLGQARLGLSPAAVVLEFMCGATNALDVYSAYLTPGQLGEVYSQIEGNFVGLGIELKAHDSSLLIVRVIPGSPAERGGIRDGDLILSVDGRATHDVSTDTAANLLQGVEGSICELDVLTTGQPPRHVSVRRARVEVPSIDRSYILENTGGVAYMRLTCFQKTTSRDMDAVLWRLHGQGMRSLIIDLRGNPGGLLVSAVELVDKFADNGVIVSTRGRNPEEDFVYTAQAPGTWRVPLVVLIDDQSASAAEIFAGAIHDLNRGVVVGTRSYGKGSVQGIFPLNCCSAGLRLTTARFYSPLGKPYNRVGVEPHRTVHQVARPIAEEGGANPQPEDAVLASGIEVARGLIRK